MKITSEKGVKSTMTGAKIVPENMEEAMDLLYSCIGYLKNTTGYDDETTALENTRRSIMQRN